MIQIAPYNTTTPTPHLGELYLYNRTLLFNYCRTPYIGALRMTAAIDMSTDLNKASPSLPLLCHTVPGLNR